MTQDSVNFLAGVNTGGDKSKDNVMFLVWLHSFDTGDGLVS